MLERFKRWIAAVDAGSIHPWRWRLLTLWIVVFTCLNFYVVSRNREAIHDLRLSKAAITSLQNTNCALRSFLATAREVRLRAAKDAVNPAERRSDLRAAHGYKQLSDTFDGHSCPS